MMWPKPKNDASSVWLYPTIFLSILQCISAKLTAEECRSLGFTSNLVCSTCDELPQFKLQALVENCNGCCQADQNETVVEKYASAVLEVCNWKIGRFPQIQAFVRGEKRNQFPNLEIKYLRGKDPVMKLYDSNGEMKEELSIDKWNTDSVEEFLKEKLL